MLGQILFITISLLGVNGFIIFPPEEYCEDKCLAYCQGKKCEVTEFTQTSSCSYSCNVNGVYQYYTEPDFQTCGTNKMCYQGQCIGSYDTRRCQKLYGKNYIALEDPSRTCTILCVPLSGCGNIFEENVPDKSPCAIGYSNILGTCRSGICVTKYRYYDPIYPPVPVRVSEATNVGAAVQAGVNIGAAIKAGANIGAAVKAGANVGAAVKTGVDVGAAVKAGVDVGAALKAGVDVGAALKAGVDVGAAVKAGVDVGAAVKAGVDVGAAVKAGVDVGAALKAGVDVGAAVKAGAKVGAAVKAGVDVGAAVKAGVDVGAAVKAGAKVGTAVKAGVGAGVGAVADVGVGLL